MVAGNPYINRCHVYEDEKATGFQELIKEQFNLVIDLHKNLRSRKITRSVGVASLSFNKLNVRKWLSVRLKWPPLPNRHIVDRYFLGMKRLGIKNDHLGMDFFVQSSFEGHLPDKFIVMALGAAHATKMMPESLVLEIANQAPLPIVLIGGPKEEKFGERIAAGNRNVFLSVAGKCSLHQSADIINRSVCVITPDTGMMHIAAALRKKIISVWGNTVPEFGMYPYYGNGQVQNFISEVALSCRPCSKIGHEKCPKGHFKCMRDQDVDQIIASMVTMAK